MYLREFNALFISCPPWRVHAEAAAAGRARGRGRGCRSPGVGTWPLSSSSLAGTSTTQPTRIQHSADTLKLNLHNTKLINCFYYDIMLSSTNLMECWRVLVCWCRLVRASVLVTTDRGPGGDQWPVCPWSRWPGHPITGPVLGPVPPPAPWYHLPPHLRTIPHHLASTAPQADTRIHFYHPRIKTSSEQIKIQ